MKAKSYIPEGSRTVTPNLIVKGAHRAIEFYTKVFGAKETMRMPGPDGQSIIHAELQIGDAQVFLNDEFPEMGGLSPFAYKGVPVSLHIYVQNVDEVVKRAVENGSELKMPAEDMFWGDRYAKIVDPFGHEWGVACHVEDLTPDEILKRQKEWFAQMAGARK